MTRIVRNEPDNGRYLLIEEDEQIGLTEYRIDDGAIVFTHTEIDPNIREHGLASDLVRQALDDVRVSSDRRVVAQCPYVKHWIDEHAAYQDLLSR